MADQNPSNSTQRFRRDSSAESEISLPEINYRPTPNEIAYGSTREIPIWRLSFEPMAAPENRFGLDINGEITLGRSHTSQGLVDLTPCGAAELGVSRKHLLIRPTASNLFAVDLGSTNGTRRNGRLISQHIPVRLLSGDILTLGRLKLLVRIVERPTLQTALLESKSNLADAMSQLAKQITSQMDVDEVLNQVAETAMILTSAGETGIWLIDEKTGELFLEAERGVQDERVRRMRVPLGEDTLMGKAVALGKTQRIHRTSGEEQIKVKTHYLVEALVYVPITLGGATLGVLAAVHREQGQKFSKRDAQLLETIADFAAIGLQNARLYQSTDQALRRRVQELSALNEVSHTVSSSLDLQRVYEVLVDQVIKNWEVEAVHLYLKDQAIVGLIKHDDHETNQQARVLPVGSGIIGKTIRDGQILVNNNVAGKQGLDLQPDLFNGLDVVSIACVPLKVQDDIVGGLALFNKYGGFAEEDVELLRAFANPVATAVENARLFAESERRRAAILATARTFSQPLLILDEQGDVVISNQAARRVLETSMTDVFAGISQGVGRTSEVNIGDRTYLSTTDHLHGVGTIVIMQDITYVQQLESDRSEFVHMLSHDLKTLLNSILGWSDMLRADPSPERREEFLGNLTGSAERMLELINQMLQSSIAADAVQIVREQCDLPEIVSAVLRDSAGAALNKAITIDVTYGGKPYPIWADGTRLYHLLLNLVDNAVKYSPRETCVAVSLDFSDYLITIQVQDEGPGIPEQDMARLFEKYYRGTQAKLYPGTGLGLSVAWAIVEAHGGQITATNRPQGGANFTVKLPANLGEPVEG